MLRNSSADRPILLGGDSASSLSLSATELAGVTANRLVIGRNDAGSASGAITIAAGVTPNVSTLHLFTGGGITGTAGGIVLPAGSLAINAGGTVNVNGPLTNVGRLAVTAAGQSVTFNQTGAISIDTVDGVTGVSAGSFNLGAGGIAQTAPLTITGPSTFTAGANAIALTNAANDFTGAVSLFNSGANTVAVTDANGIVVGTASVGSGPLNVTAVGIGQAGPISQTAGGGAATFNAGAAGIALGNPGNDFTGPVSLNNSGSGSVTVADTNAIVLGASSLGSGALTVNAVGITQSVRSRRRRARAPRPSPRGPRRSCSATPATTSWVR